MRVYRVRIGVHHFGMTTGMVPSCCVKLVYPDRVKMKQYLGKAFRDDPILTERIEAGDIEVKEISLEEEGVF